MNDLPPIGIVDLLQLGSCNPDDLPETLPELQALRSEGEGMAELLRLILKLIRKEIRAKLGRGGAMVWGPNVYIGRSSNEWEWTDAEGLVDWMGVDAARYGRFVPKHELKVTPKVKAPKWAQELEHGQVKLPDPEQA